MQLITEITTKVPLEMVYFDYFTLEPVPQGLLIKAKSPVFAEWIKTSQVVLNRTTKQPVEHKAAAMASPNRFFPVDTLFYQPEDVWGYNKPYGIAQFGFQEYFADERPNLLWLFHKNLAEGTEITVNIPISLNNWEDYFTSCCKAIQDIWTRELRKVTISASFKDKQEAQ